MVTVLDAAPVSTSRLWTTALAPDGAGDWNFITQAYQLHDTRAAEWIVVKLGAGTSTIDNGISGIFANSNIQIFANNQLRDTNGKIWFPCFNNYVYYYDPADQRVHQLGPIAEVPAIDIHASTTLFSYAFGPDGNLYLGTQESHFRPAMIVKVDIATLALTVLGYVGSSALSYTTYAYYLAVDTATVTKIAYVAYGKTPWQLWSLNMGTGVATKLAEVTSTGNIQFQQKPEGLTVIIDTDLGKVDNVRTQQWCIDGALYAYTAGYNPASLPFAIRNVTPASNPLVSPPQVDFSAGAGLVRWRANGSSGAYTSVNYTYNNTFPVPIESLVTLPSGKLLGNAQQYSGFFVHDPDTHVTEWFGVWIGGLSAPTPLLHSNGLVYLAGYPNSALYAYDPSQAWNQLTNPKNPLSLGDFHATNGAKYNYFLIESTSKTRIYAAGRREREGIGSGVGYYDLVSRTFAGTYAGLNFLDPRGFLIMDAISRVVFSGVLHSDPSFPGQTPLSAQLVVYDMDLNEVVRWTVSIALHDTGLLYPTKKPYVVLGLSAGSSLLYWFDINNGALLKSFDLTGLGAVGVSGQRGDGNIAAVIGSKLYAIDPEEMSFVVVEDLTATQAQYGAISSLVWSDGGFTAGGSGVGEPVDG